MSAKKPPIRPHQRPLKGDQVDKAIELSKDSPAFVQGKNTGFDVYVRLSDCTIQYDAKTPLCGLRVKMCVRNRGFSRIDL